MFLMPTHCYQRGSSNWKTLHAHLVHALSLQTIPLAAQGRSLSTDPKLNSQTQSHCSPNQKEKWRNQSYWLTPCSWEVFQGYREHPPLSQGWNLLESQLTVLKQHWGIRNNSFFTPKAGPAERTRLRGWVRGLLHVPPSAVSTPGVSLTDPLPALGVPWARTFIRSKY